MLEGVKSMVPIALLFSFVTAIVIGVIANGDVISIISIILSGISGVGSFATFLLGKDADKKKVVGFSTLSLAVVCLGLFVWLHYFNQPPPPPHQWSAAMQEFQPGCSDSSWAVPGPDNSPFSCPGSGLLVRQTNQQGGAEVDLDKVNGGTYNQTSFHVKVQVQFQSTFGQVTRDGNTVANLLVQTPPTPGTYGGYTFGLNDTGYWELKSVPSQGTSDILVSSGSITINMNQPISLEVDVQNNQLTGFINGQQVVNISDTLNPSPGVIGLVVEWHATNSTTEVEFRNFELDL